MAQVTIIGAGLSGLACARAIGNEAEIYEASSHVGGHAFSHKQDGFAFDEGAHICHSKDPWFLEQISASDQSLNEIQSCSVRSYWQGAWHRYPVQNHLHELPMEARAQALNDFILAQQKNHELPQAKNYHEWCMLQYGEFLTKNFYEVYTKKYWRVPMQDLGTDWLAGRLLPSQVRNVVNGALGLSVVDQAAFAQFRYPKEGGFSALFDRSYAKLESKNHLNSRMSKIDLKTKKVFFENGNSCHYEKLVSTIALPNLIRMLSDSAPSDVLEAASVLRHTKLLCVNMTFSELPKINSDHWFYVYDEEIPPARFSLVHNLQGGGAGAAQAGIQAEIFALPHEEWDKEALAEKTLLSLNKMLQFDAKRMMRTIKTVEIPYSYIHSDHHRAQATELICAWLERQSIYPLGLLGRWKYIWSDEAFRQGHKLGQKLREDLDAKR